MEQWPEQHGHHTAGRQRVCDYDPFKKKADIGSNFLERE